MDLSSKSETVRFKRMFQAAARHVCPGWTVPQHQAEAVYAIFRWCVQAPAPLDPDRGLWIYGPNGSGKTTMLRIVWEFSRRIGRRDAWGRPYGFRLVNAADVCAEFADGGFDAIRPFCELRRQAFDEVGSEEIPTAHFGTQLNVIQHILQMRYDRRHDGDFTHVTSNYGPEQIPGRYGVRIYDRCRDMFNFVYLGGASRRQAAIDLGRPS